MTEKEPEQIRGVPANTVRTPRSTPPHKGQMAGPHRPSLPVRPVAHLTSTIASNTEPQSREMRRKVQIITAEDSAQPDEFPIPKPDTVRCPATGTICDPPRIIPYNILSMNQNRNVLGKLHEPLVEVQVSLRFR